jgi:hypothetical protein
VADLVRVFRERLFAPVPEEGTTGDYRHLAEETLALLEALNWDVPDDMVDQYVSRCCRFVMDFFYLLSLPCSFGPALRKSEFFVCLLASSRPPWLLYRGARLAALLASRPSLCKLMLQPDIDASEDGSTRTELPLLSAAAALLIDDLGSIDVSSSDHDCLSQLGLTLSIGE